MLSAQLRSGTEQDHRRLEERLDLLNRIQTVGQYRDLLKNFYSFYLRVEPELLTFEIDFQSRGLTLRSRMKTESIRADLLQLRFDESEASPLGRDEIPKLKSFSAAVGCMYVLEGSTLGGQIITKHFQKTLPPEVQPALRFYSGYGEDTGNQWREFKSFLDRTGQVESPEFNDEVIRVAGETFQKLEKCLCRN